MHPVSVPADASNHLIDINGHLPRCVSLLQPYAGVSALLLAVLLLKSLLTPKKGGPRKAPADPRQQTPGISAKEALRRLAVRATAVRKQLYNKIHDKVCPCSKCTRH
jgi:hypothetical protein